MQHKRGTFFQFDGKEVEIRDYALLKMGNAQRAQEIRIDQIGMASKRIADDYPELAGWFCLKIMGTREFAVEEALKKAGFAEVTVDKVVLISLAAELKLALLDCCAT